MKESFRPGNHLAVWRPFGYRHHGIYVSDERVIQFGGGLSDKPRATIGVVTLDEFAREGRVRAIGYPPVKMVGWKVQEAERADRVVRKAEWLLERHNQWLGGKRRYSHYNVIANNCEHAATFCATTVRAESTQISLVFNFLTLISILLNLSWVPKQVGKRLGKKSESTLEWVFIVTGLVGSLTSRFHNFRHRRYWQRVGQEWLPIERAMSERFDPGDHLIAVSEHRVYHGIYVADNRVIRFSRMYPIDSGPSLEVVSLPEFEVEDEVTLIVDRPRCPAGRGGSDGIAPESVVARAEWLLAEHPAIKFPTEESRRRALEWCAGFSTGWEPMS